MNYLAQLFDQFNAPFVYMPNGKSGVVNSHVISQLNSPSIELNNNSYDLQNRLKVYAAFDAGTGYEVFDAPTDEQIAQLNPILRYELFDGSYLDYAIMGDKAVRVDTCFENNSQLEPYINSIDSKFKDINMGLSAEEFKEFAVESSNKMFTLSK